ncbi:armadillo-type protein [Hyaloraphidium curvatum]|nr:armadillo-type protein [Hyaloraphidium curvatum]
MPDALTEPAETNTPGAEGSEDAHAQRRRELRAKNLEASKSRPGGSTARIAYGSFSSGTADLSSLKNLDASLKRNTSFIKKLKASITPESLPSLLAEVAALKLEKYLSEVIGSIVECRLRNGAEVFAAVEVCSALHQRYSDFAAPLVASLLKLLGPPPVHQISSVPLEQREKEDAARISRQRTALRLLVELYLVKLAGDPKGDKDGLIFGVVRDLFGNDKTHHVNLSLAVTFSKFYGQEFLPGQNPPLDAIVGNEQRSSFKALLGDYWNSAARRIKSDHNRLRDMSRSLADHAIARGDVSEDRQQRYENALKAHEKLMALVSSLAEALGETMPELKGLDEDTANVSRLTGIGVVMDGGSSRNRDDSTSSLGPWEDEETKFFYENLVDLKDFVPGILLGEKQKDDAGATAEKGGEEDTTENTDEAKDLGEESRGADAISTMDTDIADEERPLDDDEAKETGAATSQPQLDALLARLPNAMNRTAIDQLAIDFCYINTKLSRRKLARAMLSVPRQRLDLLPYYARMLAILKPYMPDVLATVADSLDSDFRRQQRRRDTGSLDDKIKVGPFDRTGVMFLTLRRASQVVRYIGELTKFKIIHLHVTFHCIKVLLDDFAGQNIEVLANFLECCGRFLAKSTETSQRMANMLDIMMRKKAVQHLDNRQVLMIENAYYQCNPPDKPAVSTKVRTPMEAYIRRLLYSELSRASSEKILKLLRKLDWDAGPVCRQMEKILTKIWKVRFSNVHLVAFLVAELSLYHPELGVKVVDGVLEEVRLGLEQNIFKHNQRRIACVKYLGELYNYRMLDSAVIFDTLYLLLTFGHGGMPRPDVFNPADAPHDFFRVRLVCALLDPCGPVFAKGTMAKKLDAFLVFLQLYVKTKIEPPLDIIFLLQETFEALRPSAKRYESFEEALEALKDLASAAQAAAATDGEAGAQDDADEDDEEDTHNKGAASNDGSGGPESDGSEGSESDSGSASSDDQGRAEASSSEDEAVIVHVDAKGPTQEEEEDFEKEFNKILQESVESRRSEKRVMNLFDVAIPVRGARQDKQAHSDDEQSSGDEDKEKGGVTFAVLTKKGSKQQTRMISLPADSAFAINTLKKQEADRAEQAALKKLVLDSVSADPERSAHAPPTRKGGKLVLFSNTTHRGP